MSETEPTTGKDILASHYASCFGTESGAIVLRDLEAKFYVNQPAFIKNGHDVPYDVIEAGIRDGRRQVVETILNTIRLHKERPDKPKQTKAKR